MLSSFNEQGYSNINLYLSIPIYVRIEVIRLHQTIIISELGLSYLELKAGRD